MELTRSEAAAKHCTAAPVETRGEDGKEPIFQARDGVEVRAKSILTSFCSGVLKPGDCTHGEHRAPSGDIFACLAGGLGGDVTGSWLPRAGLSTQLWEPEYKYPSSFLLNTESF